MVAVFKGHPNTAAHMRCSLARPTRKGNHRGHSQVTVSGPALGPDLRAEVRLAPLNPEDLLRHLLHHERGGVAQGALQPGETGLDVFE